MLGHLAACSATKRACLLIGAGIVGLLLVKAALVFVTVSLAAWINGRINDDMRRSLYRQMLTVDYSFLIRNEQGRLVSAFETQVWRVMDAMIELCELLITFCTDRRFHRSTVA